MATEQQMAPQRAQQASQPSQSISQDTDQHIGVVSTPSLTPSCSPVYSPALQQSEFAVTAALQESQSISQSVSPSPLPSPSLPPPPPLPSGPIQTPPPPPLPSRPIQTPDMGQGVDGGEGGDLREFLKALPTRSEMEAFVQRLEQGYRTDIQAVKTDLQATQVKTSELEGSVTILADAIHVQDQRLDMHESQIQTLYSLIEDQDNRNRRNNIRIRGLPEAMGVEDLPETVKGIFISILGTIESVNLEIDRVHRALGPRNPDPAKPRDIICRIHYFRVKEDIMRKARTKGLIEYKGNTIQLLSDLCHFTLEKRKALKPLLVLLQDRNISYRWNFPFQLQIRKEGKWLSIRGPSDIPAVATALELPELPPLEWPQSYSLFLGEGRRAPVLGNYPGRSGTPPPPIA